MELACVFLLMVLPVYAPYIFLFEIHSKNTTFKAETIQDEILKKLNMPEGLVMRHAVSNFAHIFSGDGYSSGYYSYLWSEVMDCDAFEAFKEKNNYFDETFTLPKI
mgnify:CR=1 FL=1